MCKNWGGKAMRVFPHHMSSVGHEDGEVGEVTARAGGVGLICPQELASLSGPVSHHASLWVVPKRTVWVEVILGLKSNQKITINDEYGLVQHSEILPIMCPTLALTIKSTYTVLYLHQGVRVWRRQAQRQRCDWTLCWWMQTGCGSWRWVCGSSLLLHSPAWGWRSPWSKSAQGVCTAQRPALQHLYSRKSSLRL